MCSLAYFFVGPAGSKEENPEGTEPGNGWIGPLKDPPTLFVNVLVFTVQGVSTLRTDSKCFMSVSNALITFFSWVFSEFLSVSLKSSTELSKYELLV